MRWSPLGSVSLILVLLAVPVSSLDTGAKASRSPRVLMGMSDAKVEDACVFFFASMSSADFFQDIERIGPPRQTQFRKGSEFVESYPEKITADVDVHVGPCQLFDEEVELSRAEKIVGQFIFEANWKRGMKMRPAEITWLARSRGPHRPMERWPGQVRNIWCFELSIPSYGVPLTDHLIVSVFTPDGKRISRFSGRL